MRLSLSPEKSEYIVVSNNKDPNRQLISPHLNQHPIPRRTHIKILGVSFQQNGATNLTINKLIQHTNKVTQMLKRVAKQHRGLKEREIVRASEAMIYSRILYHLPHLNPTRTQIRTHPKRTL